MNTFKIYIIGFICLTFTLSVQAQNKKQKSAAAEQIINDRIEKIAEVSQDEELDLVTLFDELFYYYEHPLNLNTASREDLESLNLLTDYQIAQLLEHREKFGNFISIYELQAVPGFDLETIYSILPFVRVTDRFESPHVSFNELLKNGKNELFIRWSRVLEQAEGYKPIDDSLLAANPNKRYLGSPDKLYTRYRFKFGTNLSLGFTGEKDAGEEFFKGSQPYGFDFYSGHFFLKKTGLFKRLAIGDYQVQLGQGLTWWSGRAFRKSAAVMSVKRNALILKPYTSVNENNFMRGAAASLPVLKKFEITGFVSRKGIDANINTTDTLDDEQTVTSFQNSGLHRTPNELQDRKAVKENIFGSHFAYLGRRLQIGATAIKTIYSHELNKNVKTYNQFDFQGKENFNGGIDYNWLYRNFNFFGEFAVSQNGGWATVHGVIATLSPTLTYSLIYRNYQPDYHPTYSAAIGELSKNANEKGLYMALEGKLSKEWSFSAYFDQFQFPWLRSNITSPSEGFEYLTQLTYKPSKKLEIYARFREEKKQQNGKYQIVETNFEETVQQITQDYVGIDEVVWRDRENLRLNATYKLTDALRMRSRIEFSWYKSGNEPREKGVLAYQDVMYKPLGKPYSFSMRYALFDTDSYNTRIYAYENDVLYYFSVPAYYYRGSKFYINLRYRVVKGFDVWLRFAQTYYSNRNEISSGLNKIDGNTKTEVRAQVRFSF